MTLGVGADDVLVGSAAAVCVLGGWAMLERGRLLRVRERWPAVLATALAAAVLAVLAEDVLNQEHDQIVLTLDVHARMTVKALAGTSTAAIASILSRLTGEGLVGVVLGTAGALVAMRRRWDAAILVAGTLGAWVLSNGLKLVFAVTRPRGHQVFYEISGYGFPSAHAVVTLVGAGLIAWLLGRDLSPRRRLTLYAAAGGVTALAGAARIVLDAHWLSDVVAGFAVGLLWLTAVITAASRWAGPARLTVTPGASR